MDEINKQIQAMESNRMTYMQVISQQTRLRNLFGKYGGVYKYPFFIPNKSSARE